MTVAQVFEKSIRDVFKGGNTMDLQYFKIIDELDYPALLQSVRHHAETVFTYRINAVEGAGRDYRSRELFPERATLLYSCLAPFSEAEIGIVRMLELWMHPDFSFSVVANMEIVIADGAIVSEYRVIKTNDQNELHEEIPIDLTDFAKNLRDLCRDYLKARLPCYEL